MLEAIGGGSRRRIGSRDWAEVHNMHRSRSLDVDTIVQQIYIDSPEFAENKREIERLKQESISMPYDADSTIVHTEYATPWLYQLKIVSVRTFRSFWRQADYGFTCVVSFLFLHSTVPNLFCQSALLPCHHRPLYCPHFPPVEREPRVSAVPRFCDFLCRCEYSCFL